MLLLSFSALALGCRETRTVAWRFEVPASLGASAIVVARIREGGCNDGDLVVYEVRPRDASRSTLSPPELDPDEAYCFDVTAEDPAAGCAAVARSTVLVTPGTREATLEVVNVLDPAHPRLSSCAAPALCSAQSGCVRCPESEVACDGPPRCCLSVLGCGPDLVSACDLQ